MDSDVSGIFTHLHVASTISAPRSCHAAFPTQHTSVWSSHHSGKQLWVTAKIQCLMILNMEGQLQHRHCCYEGNNTGVPRGQDPALLVVWSHCSAWLSPRHVPPCLFVLSVPHPAQGNLKCAFIHSVPTQCFRATLPANPSFQGLQSQRSPLCFKSLTLITLLRCIKELSCIKQF